MNLHRALEHDWSTIAPEYQNFWQRIAHKTNGYITPANIITLIGFSIFLAGLLFIYTEDYIFGATLLLAGRLADIADGYVAHATGTKSPVGEALDASIDKIESLLVVACLAIWQILPIGVIAAIIFHAIAAITIFALARERNGRVHVNAAGKIATLLEWFYIGVFTLVQAFNTSFLPALGYIGVIIATILVIFSTYDYYIQYKKLGEA